MSIRKRSHIAIIVVLVVIGITLIPMVSAGSNVVTSSTGKLIVPPSITPYSTMKWYTFSSWSVSLVPPPPTLEELYGYNESSTACGNCGANWDSLLNIPIQPHFTPAATVLNLRIDGNGKFIYDSVYNETSVACGNCGGNREFYSYG